MSHHLNTADFTFTHSQSHYMLNYTCLLLQENDLFYCCGWLLIYYSWGIHLWKIQPILIGVNNSMLLQKYERVTLTGNKISFPLFPITTLQKFLLMALLYILKQEENPQSKDSYKMGLLF